MDDYHEFRHAMRFKLKSGGYIGLSIMFLSLQELWPQVVQWQLLALVQQMGAEVAIVMEPLEVVELPKVVVQGHPLVYRVYCMYLTQLWNSSMNCGRITKGLRLKSCEICKISNISPMN
jgi:hypothetical protein